MNKIEKAKKAKFDKSPAINKKSPTCRNRTDVLGFTVQCSTN